MGMGQRYMMLEMEEDDFVNFIKVDIAKKEHHVISGTHNSGIHGNCVPIVVYLLFLS